MAENERGCTDTDRAATGDADGAVTATQAQGTRPHALTACPIAPAPCAERLFLCWPSMVDEDLWNYDLVLLEGSSKECTDLVFIYGWRVSTGEYVPSPGWILDVPSICRYDFRAQMNIEWLVKECNDGGRYYGRDCQTKNYAASDKPTPPQPPQPGALTAGDLIGGAALGVLSRIAMAAARGAFGKKA